MCRLIRNRSRTAGFCCYENMTAACIPRGGPDDDGFWPTADNRADKRRVRHIAVVSLQPQYFWASETRDAQAQRRKGADAVPAVTTIDVKTEPVSERIAAVGSGRALQQVTLTTRVAGVISEVLFEGGQKVEAGQPLLKLNSEPEAIAVETADAQRAQAADAVARYKQLNEAVRLARRPGRGGDRTQGCRRRLEARSR